jgi:hypothetical protein
LGVGIRAGGGWVAQAGRRYIGLFDSIEEAAEAVQLARRRLFTASFGDRAVTALTQG